MDGPARPITFISTTGNGLARVMGVSGQEWVTDLLLPGVVANCLAADPLDRNVLYAGTEGQGVLRSADKGSTWQPAGIAGKIVKSLVVSPTTNGTLYAGVRPAAIFISRDSGSTWAELEGFRKVKEWFWFSPVGRPYSAYVQSIVLAGADAGILVAGIEAGAVVLSTDGGLTWQGYRRGALRDCHMLAAHQLDRRWVYEAGGSGGGAAFSNDGGLTWQKRTAGLDRHYGWAVAADPADPRTWYVSMAPGPFKAHVDGKAEAFIFRSMNGGPWEKLGGGLPQPLRHMPYSLLTDPQAPGHIYAALSNGDIWHSPSRGDDWTKLPFSLGGVQRSVILL
jgi:hypothetical protein